MRIALAGCLTLVLAGLAGPASAQTAAADTQQTAATTSSAPAPAVTAGKTVTVTVTVVYNKAKKPIGITVSPDPVAMDKTDTLSWDLVSDYQDDMTITMVDGTKPFGHQPNKHSKKHSASDNPTSPDDVYKYLITVKTESGKTLKLDPIIKITP